MFLSSPPLPPPQILSQNTFFLSILATEMNCGNLFRVNDTKNLIPYSKDHRKLKHSSTTEVSLCIALSLSLSSHKNPLKHTHIPLTFPSANKPNQFRYSNSMAAKNHGRSSKSKYLNFSRKKDLLMRHLICCPVILCGKMIRFLYSF